MKRRMIDLFGFADKNGKRRLRFMPICTIIWFGLAFLSGLSGRDNFAWAAGENNAAAKTPIVVAPSKLPPVTLKQQGKDALTVEYMTYPGGEFSVKTIPKAGLSAKTTQATVTCNNGVSSIDFDPHSVFEGVLDGCIAGKMPKITFN
ncbi:MAG: hypothetical protein ORN98_10905 [Alphaproteobacteria bacterium]|nr:hypothetical protein [Alphaproteobacteria bacterium]